MAKKEQQITPKSKITVMLFQLEGTDETLQEGIRTIGNSIGAVIKPLRALPAKSNGSLHQDIETSLEETEVPAEEPAGTATVDEQQTRETKTSKPRTPKIIDLDMKSSKPSLKEFCDQKKVGDTDRERYLAIAYWLKEKLNIGEVTMDHIHTCYRFMNWQTPADASAPLRTMKVSGWFNKGSAKGSYTINHVGENKVMQMGSEK